MAAAVRSPMTGLQARFARGKVEWNLDDLEAASEIYSGVITEADKLGFGKVAADSRFNRALLLSEREPLAESRMDFFDARRRYSALGDGPSVADVDRWLDKLGFR